MYKDKHIFAVIPAKGHSHRLKNKNTRLLLGKPLLCYGVEACKNSKFVDVDRVYVSTESDRVVQIAKKCGASILRRSKKLTEDTVTTQDVMKHFASKIKGFDILVLVQANSPQVNPKNIDKAVKLLVDNNLWEVRSVSKEGLENGAFWVVKKDVIFWEGLSVYFGVVRENAVDIHYKKDLDKAKEMIKHGYNYKRSNNKS